MSKIRIALSEADANDIHERASKILPVASSIVTKVEEYKEQIEAIAKAAGKTKLRESELEGLDAELTQLEYQIRRLKDVVKHL